MNKNTYSTLWVSFSSISNFLNCPRSYYLKNMYKNPKTGNKMGVVKPALSLGSAVHNVLEPLAKIPIDERFSTDILETFAEEFEKHRGKVGGFLSDAEFEDCLIRGKSMLTNVLDNRTPLLENTYVLQKDLLVGWLSRDEDIKVCGKIDWINIDENTENLTIIDFKTNKEEDINDLQLKTYALLLFLLNKNPVNSLSYWFIDINSELTEVDLPDVKEAHKHILDTALKIRQARESNELKCSKNGCFHCRDFEKIFDGEGELVGTGKYNTDLYFV